MNCVGFSTILTNWVIKCRQYSPPCIFVQICWYKNFYLETESKLTFTIEPKTFYHPSNAIGPYVADALSQNKVLVSTLVNTNGAHAVVLWKIENQQFIFKLDVIWKQF